MGHVQDRWYRPARDSETGTIRVNERGKPIVEKTELHGSGTRYKVRYIDPDGQERSKSFPDKQKKRAEDFLVEVESDKREGKYVDPHATRKTFRQLADNWLRAQSTDPATREILRSRLDSQIHPTFGNLKVGRVKPSTVRDWLAELESKKLSNNYKLVLFTLVSAVLDSAVDDRLIRDNPCKARTVRRPVGGSPPVIVWPEYRVHAVRSVLSDRFSLTIPLGSGLGLRQGEVLGLSADDIDDDERVVHIRRQLKTVKGVKMFAPPKGGKTRTVPVSAAILAEIDAHVAQHPATPVTLPWRTPDGEDVCARLLVTGEHGGLYSGDLFSKVVWRGAFRRANLDYRPRADGMHALRHFYASTLLARGVSIVELANYLGHSDPGFTLRTYTHLVPSSHERARQAVDAVFALPVEHDGLEAA